MKRKHPKAEFTPKPREEALPPEVRPGQSVELLKQLQDAGVRGQFARLTVQLNLHDVTVTMRRGRHSSGFATH